MPMGHSFTLLLMSGKSVVARTPSTAKSMLLTTNAAVAVNSVIGNDQPVDLCGPVGELGTDTKC
jgi:hypothetical protein